MTHWIKRINYNDGGRIAAGFKCSAKGDCVVRALSILTGRGYMTVYVAMSKLIERERGPNRSVVDDGIYAKTYKKYLNELGASKFKSVTKWQDIPLEGKYLVITDLHAVAYIDGVVNDTFDPVNDPQVGELCGYYAV
jgi:hypothetical protein